MKIVNFFTTTTTIGLVCLALGLFENCLGASIGFEGSISIENSLENLGILDKLKIIEKSNEIPKDLKNSLKTLLGSITKNGVNPIRSIAQDALNQAISNGQSDLEQITQFLAKFQENLEKMGESVSKPLLTKLISAIKTIQDNITKNSNQVQKALEKGLKNLQGQIEKLKNLLQSGLNQMRNLSLPDLNLDKEIDQLTGLLDSGKLTQTLAKIVSSVQNLQLTFTQALQLLMKFGDSTVQGLVGTIMGGFGALFSILFLPFNLIG